MPNLPQASISRFCGEPALNLEWHPTPGMNVRHGFDVAEGIGEYEAVLAVGAFEPPLLERVHDHRREGNVTLARLGLWGTNFLPTIGTLTDVNLASVKINIAPRQAAQFTQPHSGEYRRDDERQRI
jgi:hypothetical protein